MNTKRISILIAAITVATTQLPTRAGDFHLAVGLTYAQGVNKAWDEIETLYQNNGFTVSDSFVLPVGLSLNPYYEFESGLAIGLDLGPATFIAIDEIGSGASTANLSYIVPVGADVRYTFFRDKNISPYVRVGVRYPIVGGDNLDSSDPGLFGVVGIEFWRKNNVGMAFEVGYDTSKISVKGPIGTTATKSVNFPGVTASLCVTF